MEEKNLYYPRWKIYNDYVMLILCTDVATTFEKNFILQMQKIYDTMSDKQKSLLEKIICKYYPCARVTFNCIPNLSPKQERE